MDRASLPSRRVCRDTVAERPVLLPDLDEVDQNILAPETDRCLKAVGDGLVERLLLRDRAAFIPGDLDHHEIRGAVDSEVFGVELETVGVMLGDDLKAVVFRDADADKRLINDVTDLLAVGRILAFTDVDSNKWHVNSPGSLNFSAVSRSVSFREVCAYAATQYLHMLIIE